MVADGNWFMQPCASMVTSRRHLIESLHSVQESFGYVDEAASRYVALSLRASFSKGYGVSTFFHFFTPEAPRVSTLAWFAPEQPVHQRRAEAAGCGYGTGWVKPGKTTRDDLLSLLTARCVGSCGLAPAVVKRFL